MYRNHNLGELNKSNIGQKVELAGWVQKIRNLGAMKFLDLRDEFGITQIVCKDENLVKQADELVTETVILVEGTVVERESIYPNLATGEIEVVA